MKDKDLIERLRLHACYLSDWRGGEVGSEDLRSFIDDFNAAASALERHQWVPCSERLPDERVPVLVWHSRLGFGGENYVVDGEFEGRPAPTHWMPMLDPPLEQGGA